MKEMFTNSQDDTIELFKLLEANSNYSEIEALINKGNINYSKTNEEGTPLHIAVSNNNIKTVKLLLEKDSNALNIQNKSGLLPLHIACNNQNSDILKILIAKGADLNYQNSCANDLVHLAVEKDKVELLKILVEKKGLSMNIQGEDGFQCVQSAVKCESFNALKYLLERGANLNVLTSEGDNLAHLALKSYNINYAILKLLVVKGLNVNLANNIGWRPIHETAERGKLPTLKYLLERGADLNALTREGDNLVHLASKSDDWTNETLKFLVEAKGMDITLANNKGWQPIHTAAVNGRLEALKYLLKKGADFNALTSEGDNLVHLVFQSYDRDNEILKFLVEEKGIDITLANNKGWQPIHMAAVNGRLEALKYLLKKGVDFNALTGEGKRPIDLATEENKVKIQNLEAKELSVSANKNELNPRSISSSSESTHPPMPISAAPQLQPAVSPVLNRQLSEIAIVKSFIERNEKRQKLPEKNQDFAIQTAENPFAFFDEGVSTALEAANKINLDINQKITLEKLKAIEHKIIKKSGSFYSVKLIFFMDVVFPIIEGNKNDNLKVILNYFSANKNIQKQIVKPQTSILGFKNILTIAIEANNHEAVKLILEYLAKHQFTFEILNGVACEHDTPLAYAIKKGNIVIIKEILEEHFKSDESFNINDIINEDDNSTLLHLACSIGDSAVIELLIVLDKT